VLEDLLRRARAVWRERYRVDGFRLDWRHLAPCRATSVASVWGFASNGKYYTLEHHWQLWGHLCNEEVLQCRR